MTILDIIAKTLVLSFFLLIIVTKIPGCSSEDVDSPHISNWRISPLKATALKMQNCDQSMIPTMDTFELLRFSGGWYEVGKTVSGYMDLNDGMWKISVNNTATSFVYYGRNSLDYCISPINGRLMASAENPGELVLHYRTQNSVIGERIRILYTDYDNLAVVYSCQHIKESTGTCHPAGVLGAIWTRLTHVDWQTYMKGIEILSKACIDVHSVQVRNRVGPCTVLNLNPTNNDQMGYRKLAKMPFCAVPARCALHCPPCCRKMNSCVKCDCDNITEDYFFDCIEPSECPVSCEVRKKHAYCYFCFCDHRKEENNVPGICLETKEEGQCEEKIPRYYYKAITNTCEQFQYTGCEANSNNFASFDECMKTCKGGHTEMKSFPSTGNESIVISVSIILLIVNVFFTTVI